MKQQLQALKVNQQNLKPRIAIYVSRTSKQEFDQLVVSHHLLILSSKAVPPQIP